MVDENKFRLENLVVLQYAQNNCYLNVVDFMKMNREDSLGGSSISVDLQKGTWSCEEYRDKKIGEARYCSRHDSGVIGVYDKTLSEHLDSMVYTAVEITHLARSSPLDD